MNGRGGILAQDEVTEVIRALTMLIAAIAAKAAILRERICEIQPNCSDLRRGAELPLSYSVRAAGRGRHAGIYLETDGIVGASRWIPLIRRLF
jgi:hypothetical protein